MQPQLVWLSGLEHHPMNQQAAGLTPGYVREHAQVVGLIFDWGECRRQPIHVSLSSSPPPPSQINKIKLKNTEHLFTSMLWFFIFILQLAWLPPKAATKGY